MYVKKLTQITIFLTFILINLGGYVHNTGSSLACPDWPLCFGQFMPKMTGGVLFEHSHRLLGSLVGFLTLIIMVSLRKNDRFKFTGRLLLAIVIAQGLLGGLTVIFKLPPLVSTAHLALSMFFICKLIQLDHLLEAKATNKAEAYFSHALLLGLILVYAQIIWGALIRHLGLGTICGIGNEHILWCHGKLLPPSGLEQFHMGHRCLAFIASTALAVPNIILIRKSGLRQNYLSLIVILLIPIQILLGFMTVETRGIRPSVTMFHLTGATLLLSTNWKIYLKGK